ncbi:MAG TPA: hypothetical protein VFP43_22800 [Mesorhizobium sp.]|jgi:hypothetical protein|nr:hypothetical protein [Mesorhizobium sp.]
MRRRSQVGTQAAAVPLATDEDMMVERSVQQARWLLIPVFSLYGCMMLVGLLF